MLLDLVQGIEWLSGLFVRCTIQKGKEWSANDSSPYHKPHECGFKKSGVRQKGRGVWSHISVYTASRTWARLWSTILYIVAAQGGGTVKICLCRNGSIRLTKIWTVCVNWYSMQDMSKALKHYIVYSGSSGWWPSENLSVQEWVNKIDQNMNSLCFFFFFFSLSEPILLLLIFVIKQGVYSILKQIIWIHHHIQ